MTKVKNTPIFNHLRKYRKARGLKQREAARIHGFADASSLSCWEQGVCLPSVMNLFRLARLDRTSVFRPGRSERPVASYSYGSAKCCSPSLGDPYMNSAPTTSSKP